MKTNYQSTSKGNKWSLLTHFTFLLFFAFFGTTAYAQDEEAYVETDAPDYAPGSTAIIAGEYWTPGEEVTLQITHLSPLPIPDVTGITPDPYAKWTVIADSLGNVNTTWYVNEFEAGAQLELVASTASGYDYRVFFTDANPPVTISTVTISPASGSTNYGTTGTINYTVTVTRSSSGNNQTASLSIGTLPSGVSASFNPSTLDFGNGGNQVSSRTSTLTITTNATAAKPVTDNSFTVTATGTNSVSSTSAFTINKKNLAVTGSVADNKIYNGNTNATISGAVLNGIVGSDNVALDALVGYFSQMNVANNISVTAALTLKGIAKDYYTLTQPTGLKANITPKVATVVANAKTKTYGDLNPALDAVVSGTVNGDALNYSLATTAAQFSNIGDYVITVTLLSNHNYSVTPTNGNLHINAKVTSVMAKDKSKAYGTVNPLLDATVVGQVEGGDSIRYTLATTADKFSDVGSYPIAVTLGDNPNYNVTKTDGTLTISKASTTTTLTLSGYHIRYMDNLTFTAIIVPANTATPLTGTVEFKVGNVSYGTATVVPIPDTSNGSVQAMMIKQIGQLPANYVVTSIFTPTNLNYSVSNDVKSLQVDPRTASPYNATGFYTGDGFAWTTGPSTSTATLTMTAVIKDASSPTGDVRGAKVSFYFVNGTTYTAIPSAQNLPVGLIDVTDGSVGAASAIVQLNIGSANAASFQIAIKVIGAYTNNPGDALSQTLVTVSKPVAGGFIIGGSNLKNSNSSGYIMGATGLNTDFEFDIQYTKSGTNPKGKSTIMVRSYYTKDGILDSQLHTYIISTNAIALLNVGTPLATGTFSAKANLVEQLTDLSTVAIEGGATFQMVAFQNGSNQQIAITLYRKAGGVWFSSNWNKTTANTQLQVVNSGSNVWVAGGGSAPAKVAAAKVEENVVTEIGLSAYPSPFVNQLNFNLQTPNDTHARLEMFDLNGRKIAIVFDKDFKANELYNINYKPATDVLPGVLLYRLTVDTQVFNGKVIYQWR